jgi:23S rRNA (guanosine2251-2'-O)-methyltransferase
VIVVKGRKFVNVRTGSLPAESSLYGIHVIEEWLRVQPTRLRRLYVRPGAAAYVSNLVEIARQNEIAVEQADDGRLASLAGSSRHQGIVGLAREFPYAEIERLVQAPPATLLVVDRIQDPRNLGAILRTAAALGTGGVILPKDGSVPVTASVEAAAAGAAARVPVSRITNLVRGLDRLKSAGYWIVGLDAREGVPVFRFDPSPLTAVVVGGEAGMRPLLARSCDHVVHVPMPGPVESLNVSVATAVVLYEFYRRREFGAGRLP